LYIDVSTSSVRAYYLTTVQFELWLLICHVFVVSNNNKSSSQTVAQTNKQAAGARVCMFELCEAESRKIECICGVSET